MVFFSHHGYYHEEQERGNKCVVDVEIEADLSAAAGTDDLEDAVNYEQIYKIVEDQMAIRSKLLEHVGNRIVVTIKEKIPQVQSVTVKLSKIHPPVKGLVDRVSVVMTG